MDENYEQFLKKLTEVKSIKCYRHNAMHGKLFYHVLAIFDDENVAVKYYGKHKRWWHYHFFDAYLLWSYYENGWIELRK